MLALYHNDKTKQIDALAAAQLSIDSFTLMQRAGAAVFEWVKAYDRILVVTGPGNNGGDGFIIAELARQQGHAVQVLALQDPDKLRGDAALAAAQYQGEYTDVIDADGFDCVVDALFGTGLNAPLRGPYPKVVAQINQQDKPVIAVDIPSGLYGSTGGVAGIAVAADLTVAVLALNTGLFTLSGRDCCGDVVLADLQVSAETLDSIEPDAYLLESDALQAISDNRQANSHKGAFGHVLVAGGQAGMLGAALLASQAVLKSGAGLVTTVTDEQQTVMVALHSPEIMSYGFSGLGDELAVRPAQVLVLGVGLGTNQWSQQLFKQSLALDLPTVLDADGLNLLAASRLPRGQVQVITPHPKEAALLLSSSVDAVQQDRFAAVKSLARKYHCVAVLKGSGSLISDGEAVWVCPHGSANLATAGTGDMLAGLIGGLMAQGFVPIQAAQLAVLWHALAGEQSPYGLSMTATDLLNHMHQVLP